MFRKTILAIAVVLVPFAAGAQQQLDPNRLIAALETQRNNALANQARAEALAGMLSEENEKLQAKIKALEAKPADAPKGQ